MIESFLIRNALWIGLGSILTISAAVYGIRRLVLEKQHEWTSHKAKTCYHLCQLRANDNFDRQWCYQKLIDGTLKKECK